jgi:predicted acyl esterase
MIKVSKGNKTCFSLTALRPALIFAFSLAVVVVLFLFTADSLAAQTGTGALHPVSVQTNVRAKMRDGIQLVADVYRPKSKGQFPVLLERTPYSRKGDAAMASELASHGYIVVLQDTRGRYDSEGEFYPFRFESQDGYDTVEWAAALENSNGRVGMFGGSYVGATQMLAAMAEPPH